MEKLFRSFYRTFYRRTGGFIPAQPLTQSVFPGDFYQVRDGNMIILGNVFYDGVIDPGNVQFSQPAALNQAGWHFNDAVTKAYSSRGTGEGAMGGEFEYSKLILAFGGKGAFLFRGHKPESVRIMNWNELQAQMIIRLTQINYSFREVYVVTETVTTAHWTLVIAGSGKAELEIATDEKNFSLGDIFGHESAKTIRSRDIEFYHREGIKKPSFFKAKKLQARGDKMETLISRLINGRQNKNEWAGNYFEYDFQSGTDNLVNIPASGQACVLDMLPANQLNPNTALDYFKWGDANIEDVEKLFFIYDQNG